MTKALRLSVLFGVLGLVVLAGGPAAAAALPAAPARVLGGDPPKVLVIAVPDLRWSDLSPQQTPAIWRLLTEGAAGALSVKSTLSAGRLR